jgi:hypothetical protein
LFFVEGVDVGSIAYACNGSWRSANAGLGGHGNEGDGGVDCVVWVYLVTRGKGRNGWLLWLRVCIFREGVEEESYESQSQGRHPLLPILTVEQWLERVLRWSQRAQVFSSGIRMRSLYILRLEAQRK